MEPLIVTARLRNGFAASDPWSPSLDAILGYWLLRESMGEAAFIASAVDAAAQQAVVGLPLERIEYGEWWWYACSSPIYAEAAQTQRYYHRRFDALHAERHAVITRKRVETKAGPYKSVRLSEIIHTCPAVVWHVVGDGAEIQRLLHRCSAIGAKIAAGFGAVAQWTVEQDGDVSLANHYRPLAVDYATAHSVEGMEMWWGLRPPGRLSSNQTICVMPNAAG